MQITNLPNELLSNIFSHLVGKDRREAAAVCKTWREEISRAFCIEVSQNAQMLDSSWSKRWSAISLYDLSDCKENIVNLSFFFDQGYEFAPMSHRTSFYQDEVILMKQSSIYCCNYLNKKITELELPIEGTIENIHCYENSLVVLTSESVIIYDFTANRTEQHPSFFRKMKLFFRPLHGAVVGFYDKKFLVLMNAGRTCTIDVTARKYVASGNPNFDPNPLQPKTLQNFFVNQEIIAFAPSTRRIVVRRLYPRQDKNYSIKESHQLHVHSFIDESTLTYCLGTDDDREIEFRQANYNTEESGIPRLRIKCHHILQGTYRATAMWSSKQICVVGLTELFFSEQVEFGLVRKTKEPYNNYYLAFWDYREVKLISWPEEIDCIIALFGKIIINPGSSNFRFLDFTGASSIDAKTVSLVTPKKPESRPPRTYYRRTPISAYTATPSLPESPRRGSFNQDRWGRIVGITLFILLVISYVALQALENLKNRR